MPFLTKPESQNRIETIQISKIFVLNVPPPPKLCDIDKKYKDPKVRLDFMDREWKIWIYGEFFQGGVLN